MRYLVALILGATFGVIAGGLSGAGLGLAMEGGDLRAAIELGPVVVAVGAVIGGVIGTVAGLLLGIFEAEHAAAKVAAVCAGGLPALVGIPVLADSVGTADLLSGIAAWFLLVGWFSLVGYVTGSAFAWISGAAVRLARRRGWGRWWSQPPVNNAWGTWAE